MVVGIDTSDTSRRALAFAGELARRIGARLTVVFVRNYSAAAWSPELAVAYDLGVWNDEKEAAACQQCVDVLEPLGIQWEFHAANGDPADEIEAVASRHDAGLIVVGSRGFGALKSAVLGSVSTRLAHRSPRPVLVVR